MYSTTSFGRIVMSADRANEKDLSRDFNTNKSNPIDSDHSEVEPQEILSQIGNALKDTEDEEIVVTPEDAQHLREKTDKQVE